MTKEINSWNDWKQDQANSYNNRTRHIGGKEMTDKKLLTAEEAQEYCRKNLQAPLTKDELRMVLYGAHIQLAKCQEVCPEMTDKRLLTAEEINPYWQSWSKTYYQEVYSAGNESRIPIYVKGDTVYLETENSRVYEKGVKAQLAKDQQADPEDIPGIIAQVKGKII